MHHYGIHVEDIKDRPLEEFGTEDENQEIKKLRRNHREQKRWKMLRKLKDYMEDRHSP